MNLTLGTLATLKAALLPSGSVSRTDWDDVLARLGRGVAAVFARHCNRQWAWQEDAQFTAPAPCIGLALDRYPVADVSALELKNAGEEGEDAWHSILGSMASVHEPSGIVQFIGIEGAEGELIRATFDGGYWFDDSEEQDGEQPEGSTLLPDDLALAWTMQCQDVAESLSLFKHGALRPVDKQKGERALAEMTLIPAVKDILAKFRKLW